MFHVDLDSCLKPMEEFKRFCVTQSSGVLLPFAHVATARRSNGSNGASGEQHWWSWLANYVSHRRIMCFHNPIIHRGSDRFCSWNILDRRKTRTATGRENLCWTRRRLSQKACAERYVFPSRGIIFHQVTRWTSQETLQVCLEIWPIVLKQFRDSRPGSINGSKQRNHDLGWACQVTYGGGQ